jgi:hypothetical protein
MRYSVKIFLLVLAFCLLQETSAPAQSGPKTVVDYYLLLPNKYTYDIGPKRRKELINPENGRVNAIDLKNGYLSISGDAGEAGIIVALFKKPDGGYLVGVNVYNELSEDFYMLRYAGGKWSDVTRAVIPKFNKTNRYELPQYGTTINVDSETGERLYQLAWSNGKFTIKK